MKPVKPIGIYVCALFLISGTGMLLNVVLPKAENQAIATASEGMDSPPSSEEQSDIPVGSPTAYPANTMSGSVCQAALRQYINYVEARAAYLLRTDAAQENTDQFLASREQAVIGELAILSAQMGTFQGNPDHFNKLTTLAAERQAIALAKHQYQTKEQDTHHQGVKTYDFNLQC